MGEPDGESRRNLLTRAAALGGAGAAGLVFGSIAGTPGAANADTLDWVGGALKSITPGGMSLVTRQGQTRVVVSEKTNLMRDRPAKISDFRVGDSLCARGNWSAGAFVAKAVMPQYRLISFRVRRSAGRRLETTSGNLLITDDTKAIANGSNRNLALAGLDAGVSCGAFVRPEPRSGAYAIFLVWPE